MLEPNNVGATIHYVAEKADSGNIIHQVRTDIKKEFSLHDLSSVAIFKIGKIINSLIKLLLETTPKGMKLSGGRSFLLRDFNSLHLLVNYKLFNDKLTELLLKKKLGLEI